MNIHGIWPLESRKSNFVMSVSVILFFIVIPQTWKALLVYNDLDTLLEVLTVADVPVILIIVKLFAIMFSQKGDQILIVTNFFFKLRYLILYK